MAKRPGKIRASDSWGTESSPERTERVQVKVSTDEIAAIDKFRFQTECRTGRPQSVNCCAAD
jgi:hypothetical protein